MKYTVTRFCCRSGMCLECQAYANGTRRKRVVQASGLDKDMAEQYVRGWAAYDARMEAENGPPELAKLLEWPK